MIADARVTAYVGTKAVGGARRRASNTSSDVYVNGAQSTSQALAIFPRQPSAALSSKLITTVAMGAANRPRRSSYHDETSYLLASPINARRLLDAHAQSLRGEGSLVNIDELRRSLGLGEGV